MYTNPDQIFSTKAAITAGSSGEKVLFISPNKLTKLPAKIEGMKVASPKAMSNILFMYDFSNIWQKWLF